MNLARVSARQGLDPRFREDDRERHEQTHIFTNEHLDRVEDPPNMTITPDKLAAALAAPDAARALERIAGALERLAPAEAATADFAAADAFVWQPQSHSLYPVPKVNRVAMELLRGIDRVRDILY
ncbi:MAG: hypothetical protein ACLPTZ_17130, partial [Beijerinckiaceae bacterium]